MEENKWRVRQLLMEKFPDLASVTTELINLNAILQLPKGTEHFLSDLHGEYDAFCHILRNASGVIRRKIDREFEDILTQEEKTALATLIYYPEQRLSYLKEKGDLSDDWYRVMLHRLVRLCRRVASKYTRSKVRKALPKEFSYVIEELLHTQGSDSHWASYYRGILETILKTRRADAFIVAISRLIQRLSVDRLHILGDIYDRGDGAHKILDTLISYHSVDLTWGNHDILWMGAAAGNPVCVLCAVRLCLRYHNPQILEHAYGISLRPLQQFADTYYREDPCHGFFPKCHTLSQEEACSFARMHKAATVLQFKLEDWLLKRHPEYEMDDRRMLKQIDFMNHSITLSGTSFPLTDWNFPTVSPERPAQLTAEEQQLKNTLCLGFSSSQKLKTHLQFLLSHGGMYRAMNNNLMFHGCIPMTETGEFATYRGMGGKALLEYCDSMVRNACSLPQNHPDKGDCLDFFWYLWAGKHSPLFGKQKMATFERYFLKEPSLHREEKNPYYGFLNQDTPKYAEKILKEFSLCAKGGFLINGHVPVLQKNGESPVKGGGKVFVIDGGLSKAYQHKTGIAGYTLSFNSEGFFLTAHSPFSSLSQAVEHQTDIVSQRVISSPFPEGVFVKDTDTGKQLRQQIEELEHLADYYRNQRISDFR